MRAEPWRYVLVGDGQSPHLLKWAQALREVAGPRLALHLVSSRGALPDLEALVPPERRLLLHTQPRASGGNIGLLAHLPRVARWLRQVQPQVLHAHYLSSHGTLAWLARILWRVPGVFVASAWGSDILVAPQRSALMRLITSRVLRACDLSTSDSQHMAERMRELGARSVSVFPFGLPALPDPAPPGLREPHRWFSNRALEPWYRIDRVLDLFAAVAATDPQAHLVVAHEGSCRAALERQAHALGLSERIAFVGRLNAERQDEEYRRAQWYLSLPETDSVSVSVLEAMAHGCIPVLSDLPANRELVQQGVNGWILNTASDFCAARPGLLGRAAEIAAHNREWVAQHGVFAPCVARFLDELPLAPGWWR